VSRAVISPTPITVRTPRRPLPHLRPLWCVVLRFFPSRAASSLFLPLSPFSLVPSPFLAHTHTHTHTHSLTHTHTLTHSLTHSLTHPHSLTHSHTLTHTHTHSLTHTHTLTHTLTHSLTHTSLANRLTAHRFTENEVNDDQQSSAGDVRLCRTHTYTHTNIHTPLHEPSHVPRYHMPRSHCRERVLVPSLRRTHYQPYTHPSPPAPRVGGYPSSPMPSPRYCTMIASAVRVLPVPSRIEYPPQPPPAPRRECFPHASPCLLIFFLPPRPPAPLTSPACVHA
jgi:hypothetical protein